MEVTPKDINEKQFRDAWRGYNQEEVDDFLDRVAEAVETTQRENEALRGRNIELEQALSTTRDTEEMLKKTLVTAQRAAEEAIAKARAKAEQLVQEAEGRARGANEEARKIIEEAETEANRKMIDIEKAGKERRRDLDAAIGRLSAYQSELQQKLKMFLEEQQRDLEALTAGEPPSAGGNGQPASVPPPGPGVRKAPGRGNGESARVVHVDAAEDPSEVDLAPAAHKRGVRGLFFKEEG